MPAYAALGRGLKQDEGREAHLGHLLILQSPVEEEKADFQKFLLAQYGARCLCVEAFTRRLLDQDGRCVRGVLVRQTLALGLRVACFTRLCSPLVAANTSLSVFLLDHEE